MLNPKASPVRKSHKPSLPSEKTIPRSEPYPPVFPDGEGFAPPTPVTEKLIQRRAEPPVVKVFSPPREEVQKKAFAPPPTVTSGPSELDLLRREIERLRAENAYLIHNFDERRRLKEIELVLLMIEIERLHGLLDDSEHELAILRASQQRDTSYEKDNHIRSLMAKIEDYEIHMKAMTSELSQWKYRCSQLERELELKKVSIEEEVRRRIEIEISHIKMAEKAQWEGRISQLMKEKQDLEGKVAMLSLEVDRLNGLIRHYHEDADGYKRRIDELTAELARSRGNTDLQSQVILLSTEIERLNGLLHDKHHEAEHLRTRVVDIETHNARQIEQVKQAHLSESTNMEKWRLEMRQAQEAQMKELTMRFTNERAALEAEIRQLRTRITELEGRANVDVIITELNTKFMQERAGYEARIRELESKISLISVELERAHTASDTRAREADMWREKYAKLESVKIEEVQMIISQNMALSQRVSTSYDETDRILRLFKELEAEHSILNTKYQQVSKEVEEIRKVRSSYVGIEQQQFNPTAILKDVTVRVHSISTEKNEYRDSSIGSTMPQGYQQSNSTLRDSSYHH